jgi:hypothetical protein
VSTRCNFELLKFVIRNAKIYQFTSDILHDMIALPYFLIMEM